MANNPISMQRMRQVLRLRSQGKGIKTIGSLLGVSRNTVKKYLTRLEESGQSIESALELSDLDLQALLQPSVEVALTSRYEVLHS